VKFIERLSKISLFNLNTLYEVFPKTLAERLESKLLNRYQYNTKVPILELLKEEDDDLKFLANYTIQFLQFYKRKSGIV
jgi:UDP-galactopyranose mutase